MSMGFGGAVVGFILCGGGLMALGGLALAGWGVWRTARSRRLAADGRTATGVIVDNQVTSHSGEHGASLTFAPVIEYRTELGQQVTAVGPVGLRRSFIKGTQVQVRYDPAKPEQIELLSGPGRGSGGVVAIVIGLLMAVAAVVFLSFVIAMAAAATGPGVPQFELDPDPGYTEPWGEPTG
ncbi:hypothetical protein GCM10009682_27310 [Luedemannella flava]|uniref:DUF3592 domain-containing protein n=1 Tax=Luedemannella flava TaxID=349316 RepID=A0ABP4Y7L1_9ACTN